MFNLKNKKSQPDLLNFSAHFIIKMLILSKNIINNFCFIKKRITLFLIGKLKKDELIWQKIISEQNVAFLKKLHYFGEFLLKNHSERAII